MKRLILGLLLLVFAIATNRATAQITNTIFHLDEFGHGNITRLGVDQGTFGATLAPDTTPGGLANWNVLTYTLPFAGTAGDVLIFDPAIDGSPILDVLRFDGANHLLVYSDDLDGIQSPADTPGPPNPFSANLLPVDKLHISPVLATADFTPTLNEPGYDVSNPSYDFLDPGVVPEPGSGSLLLAALGILSVTRRRRKSPSKAFPSACS